MSLSATTPDLDAALLPRRRFSVREYHRMAEVGILHEDDRVELIEGDVWEKHAPGDLPLRRFCVSEYHRMAEAGILHEDERVELIEGMIVEMTPIGGPHISAVIELNRLFQRAVGDEAVVSVQNPVRLAERNEPEPDIALVRPRADRFRNGPPRREDVLLLVEVADTSLPRDRRVKAVLYALHGIPETWIVDVAAGTIEVHREPTNAGRYASVTVHRAGEAVIPLALPHVRIAVDDVFG